MDIIAIIAAITAGLKAIPDLIRIIKSIVDLFRSMRKSRVPLRKQREMLAEYNEIVERAKKTKDTAELEAFHEKLEELCADGVCENPGHEEPQTAGYLRTQYREDEA